MAWQQVRQFNINKMGKKAGWCLQNVRLGFGITSGKYPSAKADMQAQSKNGTLHHISTLPQNVAVPVYVDTTSIYEHVVVYDRGTWYGDGVKINAPNSKYVFGWGECCDGARVVEWANAKISNEEIAKEVINGLWGNGEIRKRKLIEAGYNYNLIQKLVNQMMQKKSNETVAKEVLMGMWGNGSERKRRLENAGYNYNTIQAIVNRMLAK